MNFTTSERRILVSILTGMLLLLICSCAICAEPIKVLRPGMIVNGKSVTETYYCFTESQIASVTEQLATIKPLEALVDAQRTENNLLREKVQYLELYAETLASQSAFLRSLAEKSMERELKLSALIDKGSVVLAQEKRRGKRNQLKGIIQGIGWGGLIGLGFSTKFK